MAVLNQLVIGVSIGAVLLLIALGLTFTFGQMGVINMAHGEFIMAGAYTAFLLQGLAGAQAVPAALPVAFVVAGTMGLVLERLVIRRFYGRPLDTLLLTWGVSLILQQAARDIFGAPNVQVVAPGWLTGGIRLGGVNLQYNRLFIAALAAVSGLATARVDRLTFFIGSGLAGIAGVALTLIGPIGPAMGTNIIVNAFLVVVVGGIGQLKGTVIVAFVLGMLQSMVEYTTTVSVASVIVFVAIVAFLQWRPQGLFTLRTRSLA